METDMCVGVKQRVFRFDVLQTKVRLGTLSVLLCDVFF